MASPGPDLGGGVVRSDLDLQELMMTSQCSDQNDGLKLEWLTRRLSGDLKTRMEPREARSIRPKQLRRRDKEIENTLFRILQHSNIDTNI